MAVRGIRTHICSSMRRRIGIVGPEVDIMGLTIGGRSTWTWARSILGEFLSHMWSCSPALFRQHFSLHFTIDNSRPRSKGEFRRVAWEHTEVFFVTRPHSVSSPRISLTTHKLDARSTSCVYLYFLPSRTAQICTSRTHESNS